MKPILSLAALLVLSASSASHAADGGGATITLGCFRYGVETCDPIANPPSIDLNGFQMGPVDPDEGSDVPKFKVISAGCGNGVGPKLTVGDIVDFAAGSAAVVVDQTVYQVGKQGEGSTYEVGKYVSDSEFSFVSYAQGGSVISSVDIKNSDTGVVITSTSPEVGTCELQAQ